MDAETLIKAALREAGYGPDAIGSALPRIMRILQAEDVRIEVGRHAQALAARAEALAAAWTLAKESLDAQRQETARLVKGRELGGVALAPLLAARRREREAAMAEVEARAAACGATARLLLDAHAYWIDDDGHSAEGHAAP